MSLELGTVVAVDIWGGAIQHPGIVSGYTVHGEPVVISNSLRHGKVVEETLAAFRNGGALATLGLLGSHHPQVVVTRARSRLGERWDLFRFNCEHFVRYACDLPAESPQLQRASALLGVIVGVQFLLAASR
jgi:Lecithin retinol acyltransferase